MLTPDHFLTNFKREIYLKSKSQLIKYSLWDLENHVFKTPCFIFL